MHIKLLYRKVLYVFLSVMIVFANTQTAYAASSWSVSSAVSAGARTVVTATKSGYKSAVNIAPTAGRLAIKLGKGANWASLLYAAVQLAPDLADIESFQPEYANNRIKYTVPESFVPAWSPYHLANDKYTTPELACRAYVAWYKSMDYTSAAYVSNTDTTCTINRGNTGAGAGNSGETIQQLVKGHIVKPAYVDYVSIPDAAAQVIKNANNGHADSQKATRETATEMVIGGQFDKDLLAGAVPINDTKPLVPSVPISGNGNVTHGESWEGGDGMSGAAPGEQADAAKDAADAAKKAADAAADAAKDAQQAAADAAADAEDLVNSGADQAAVDAANARAKAAEEAAKAAKDAADAAVDAANAKAAAAEKAAKAAADAAAADAVAAAKAAADAIAAAQSAAEADKAAAQAAADKAVAAAEKAKAEAEARAKAAEEAAKAAEKAKAEADKFELPAFCSWATVVCDYTKWVKDEYGNMSRWLKEEPAALPAEMLPIDEMDIGGWQDKAEAGYVSFSRECPADVLIPVSLMGASQTLNISYAGFCHFASLIRPAVILGAWISGLLIISGGRARE